MEYLIEVQEPFFELSSVPKLMFGRDTLVHILKYEEIYHESDDGYRTYKIIIKDNYNIHEALTLVKIKYGPGIKLVE